jgi:dTDP-4-dehydrorhamnose 3,5-epimerase
MILEPLSLEGAYRLRPDRRGDERGYLERLFCREDFAALGLNDCSRQVSHVVNQQAGTLRGLHFQHAPHAEAKLIWVCKGAIFDVLVDLRPASPSFGQWLGLELSADDGSLIYAPPGLAHGYLTLSDDARMVYHIDTPYAPDHAAGLRYDDPDLAIAWPAAPRVISDKDRAWPHLKDLSL